MMKIFLSWSSEPSHQIALVLHDWLPTVLQNLEPWLSSEDIAKGELWSARISQELEATSYGIIVVIPANLERPWLNFEAGALAKHFSNSRVTPFLFGLSPGDLSGMPLQLFQATRFEKGDVLKLLASINDLATRPVAKERLETTFDRFWPDLKSRVEPVLATLTRPPEAHSQASEMERNNEQVGLDEAQTRVLEAIAKTIEAEDRDFAYIKDLTEALEQKKTVVRHYLDALTTAKYVIVGSTVGGMLPDNWRLTEKGRLYVVEKGLV
jgi:hypothetical protein